MQHAVERFEAAHPQVQVEVVPYEQNLYKDKLRTAMGSRNPPDVFHTWGGGVLASYAAEGKVYELTEALQEDNWQTQFLPAALRFCADPARKEPHYYAVPLDIGVVPVWYNRDLFARYEIEVPHTFAELKEICRKLKAAGLIPFALGNRDKWPGAFFFIYFANRWGGGAPIEQALSGEGAFTHESFIRAGELVQELAAWEAFPQGFNGLTVDLAQNLFFNGRAAMMLMGSWLLARAQTEAPVGFLEKLDCFPFPQVEGGRGDPTNLVGGVNAAYAISTACTHKDLAVALLKELTSEATAREWVATGRLCALTYDFSEADIPAPARKVLALLRQAQDIQLYYDQYLPPRLAEMHKDTTHALFAGTMTPQEAAAEMEKTAREERGTS